MKAFVTGATGFVGSHLVEALRARGDEVTALARSTAKAETLTRLGVRIVPGDLDDAEALQAAAAGQDVVYHVAGAVAARDESAFLHCNVQGTINVVAAARRSGRPRFVFVSSMAAAGPAPRGAPLTGAEPPRPVTAYGRSKLGAEQAVVRSGLPWVVVRPPAVYGPRDREVLKLFQMVRWGIAPVFGDGSQELSAVHGADLAQALVAAGGGASVERIYYACHPEVFTSGDFVRTIADVMGRRARLLSIPGPIGRAALAVTEAAARLTGKATILTTDKANEFFQPAWTGDPSPLMQDTGWRAAHDLRTGMADTYAWYRNAAWL
jgi:nucleoside-diphosphate-sugar epimerase